MQTNDLYRNYIAQTAIIKALNRVGVEISGRGFDVHPFDGDDPQAFAEAVREHKSFHYSDFNEITGRYFTELGIRIFLDTWHVGASNEDRVAALTGLLRELPGDVAVVCEDDGDRTIVGVTHYTTYSLRVGKLSGRVKRLDEK